MYFCQIIEKLFFNADPIHVLAKANNKLYLYQSITTWPAENWTSPARSRDVTLPLICLVLMDKYGLQFSRTQINKLLVLLLLQFLKRAVLLCWLYSSCCFKAFCRVCVGNRIRSFGPKNAKKKNPTQASKDEGKDAEEEKSKTDTRAEDYKAKPEGIQ